jgi:hypothetical protein
VAQKRKKKSTRPKVQGVSKGLEIRAQIDTENVKGLLLVNGGGAVALLAFLPFVLGKSEYEPLAWAILFALFTFQVGLVTAIIHNRLRRICSLVYEQHNYRPPPCETGLFAKWKRREPCVCLQSIVFMWISLGAFVVAGLIILGGGIGVLCAGQPCDAVIRIVE